MLDNDLQFSKLGADGQKVFKAQLDASGEKIWNVALDANRFAQRSYLFANAGGVVASVGFLGTAPNSSMMLLAGTVALTIFFSGMCLLLFSASWQAELLQEYHGDFSDFELKILKDEIGIGAARPKKNEKKRKFVFLTDHWGTICFFVGGFIGIALLWIFLITQWQAPVEIVAHSPDISTF